MVQKERLFCYALICYLIFRIIYGSNFRYENVIPNFFLHSLYAVSCLCAILKIIIGYKLNLVRTAFGCLITCLSVYFFIYYQYYLIVPVLLILAARNVSFHKILITQYYTTIIMLGISLIAVLLGIISDTHFPKTVPWMGSEYSSTAHGLGFVYFSGFAYYTMLVSFIFMMTKKRLTSLNIIVLILVNLVVFALCFTRLQLIGVLLMIVLFHCSKYKKNFITHKIWGILAWVGYPMCFILTCVSSVLMYIDGAFDVANTVDDYSASRFALNSHAFMRYGVNLFGNKIENVNDATEYFYVDSGYVYSIVGYGILFSILLLIAYSVAFYKSFKNNNNMIYTVFFVFMILSVFNDFFIQLNYNPLLLYLFAKDTMVRRIRL